MSPDEIIAAICPALSTDSRKEMFVQMATSMTDLGFFGEQYSTAIALRAAHQYTVSSRPAGATGAITSASEGGQSISYGGSAAAGGYLEQTSYGIELKNLIRSKGIGLSVVRGPVTPIIPNDPNQDGGFRW